MKKFVVLVVSLLLSSYSFASESREEVNNAIKLEDSYKSVGIGASVQSDEYTVYLPINISEKNRLEPFVGYKKTDIKKSSNGYSGTQKSKNIYLGMGYFHFSKVKGKLFSYYGGKVAYIETESSDVNSEVSLDGYMLSPIVGLEYRFTDKFYIGCDVGFIYERLTGDYTKNGYTTNIEQDKTYTDTQVILRYMF